MAGMEDDLRAPGGNHRAGRARFVRRGLARAALGRVLAWDPVNVVMAHGTIARGGAPAFIRESFAWL